MRTTETLISALAALASLAVALPASTIHELVASEPWLQARQNTQNAKGACADVTVIFARGTTERGNVGTIVGPPLLTACQDAAGASKKVNMQGVDYPANVRGFMAGGDAAGSATMAGLVTDTAARCPKTKIVMSGYSQGGQLVHNAADQLDKATLSRVSAAVIFGDPLNGQPVTGVPASKTLVVCHNGDNICEGGSQIRRAHLTYGQDTGNAADFIMKAVAAA